MRYNLIFFSSAFFFLLSFSLHHFRHLESALISLQVVGRLPSFRIRRSEEEERFANDLRKQEDFSNVQLISIASNALQHFLKVLFVRLRHSIKRQFFL